MAIKIDIKKNVETFEIGSQTFELQLADDKMVGYLKTIKELEKDATSQTPEDIEDNPEKTFSKIEQQCRMFLDTCFGEEAYDLIYKEVNGSSYVLANVVKDISIEVERIVKEMDKNKRSNKKADYYKNIKKQTN